MSSTTVSETVTTTKTGTGSPNRRFFRNPWRHPWLLEGFTWLYLIWSLAPIAIAVLFSFNKGKSQATYQGLTWRWYWGDKVNSIWHNPALHSAMFETLKLSALTTLIAVPIGVAFALGINRWRGFLPSSFNFIMILSFVVPELIFGVALFFIFTKMPGLDKVGLGNWAEVLGPGDLERQLAGDPRPGQACHYRQAVRRGVGRSRQHAVPDHAAGHAAAADAGHLRVSAILVFAGVIDDFVVVDLLSPTRPTRRCR